MWQAGPYIFFRPSSFHILFPRDEGEDERWLRRAFTSVAGQEMNSSDIKHWD
jgi:hypothetical protein